MGPAGPSVQQTSNATLTACMASKGPPSETRRRAGETNRPAGDFPVALVTMWAWITGSRSDAERVRSKIVGPLVNRDPAELRGRVCVGSADECAELLSRYARAGCQRVHFWPVGDERRQVELIAGEVMPRVAG
jgi:alkanesulfonate monooxygenase SsuD/methylene tetrahydromethanopterin reductase-like flavin-dependent oxidoreductase (luciferase family)